MHQVKKYEFVLTAETPIAHHAEVFGNHAVIMRRKVRLPGGTWAQVPIVTGDTMRHQVREAAAYAFLDAAGMLDKGALTESALRLLFNGGMVTGRGDAANIKIDAYREMVDLIPTLGLLGGCASNRVIPGRLICEDALLICEESVHLVPEWARQVAGALDTARAHIEIAQRVRMDSTLDPGKRKLLAEGDVRQLEAKDRRRESAAESDDAVEADKSKSSMMPRTFEAIAAGSFFYWRVTCLCQSELDVDTFHTMVGTMLGNARVGGKRGTGHGLLRAVAAQGIVVNRPSDVTTPIDALAFAPQVGEMFRSHVRARADRARKFLSEVDS